MKSFLASLLVIFAISAGAQSPPQIPLTGNIGVPGSVAILGGLTVSMTSDANLTLSANQWANKTLIFTSTVPLTATRDIIAPMNKGQEFNIENSTTGGQSIRVIGATGTGITILTGTSAIVFFDGTNYIQASSAGGGFPNIGTGIVQANGASAPTVASTTQLNAAIGQSNGYAVLGDSIAASTGATSTGVGNPAIKNGYVYLMQTPIGGPFIGGFAPGDQIADSIFKWNLRVANPQGAGIDPMYVSELGTNDVTVYGSNTDKQNNFKAMMTAQLANLGMPQSSKVFAQACTPAGGFATDLLTPLATMGSISTTSGATLTCSATAAKASDTLYVVYQILDTNGGTFTISVDGTPQTDPISGSTTFVNGGYNGSAILTQNGTTNGYAAARLTGFASGAHSVVITVTSTTGATNKVPVEWVGFAPVASTANNPLVYAVSPNAQNGTPNASLVTTYQGFISTIVTNLAADGLNTTYVNTAAALLSSVLCGNGNQATMFANCYSDTIHPNNTGHAVMATTIMAAMPPARLTGITVESRYQRLQNWVVSSMTAAGSSLYGPAHFFDVNPYNITGNSTSWVPGIKFQGNNGQLFWMGFQSGTGLTIGAPNGVSGFQLCQSGSAGLSAPLPPTLSQCHFSWQTNGLINFFQGSTAPAGLSIQSNLLTTGTTFVMQVQGQLKPVGSVAGASTTASGPSSIISPTNASNNNNSAPWCYKGGVWNDATLTPGFDGPCWQFQPTNPTPTGQGPRGYMTLIQGVTTLAGLDLRNTTLTNHLGTNADVSTINVLTEVDTPKLVVNGNNFSLVRGVTASLGGSALTAGQCSSTGNISVSVTVGSGSVVNVSPGSGSPGDQYYWRGFPTGAGTINIQVCAVTAGTPTAQVYFYEINP